MVILLDLDGVLITTPAWRAVETAPDSFFIFNDRATKNLVAILTETNAAIVLTTSHRIKYTLAEWKAFFNTRGLTPSDITKVNDKEILPPPGSRASEIVTWVAQHGAMTNYIILDDDVSLYGLPAAIKQRCIITKPLIGLDDTAANQAIQLLRGTTTLV